MKKKQIKNGENQSCTNKKPPQKIEQKNVEHKKPSKESTNNHSVKPKPKDKPTVSEDKLQKYRKYIL